MKYSLYFKWLTGRVIITPIRAARDAHLYLECYSKQTVWSPVGWLINYLTPNANSNTSLVAAWGFCLYEAVTMTHPVSSSIPLEWCQPTGSVFFWTCYGLRENITTLKVGTYSRYMHIISRYPDLFSVIFISIFEIFGKFDCVSGHAIL